MAKAVLKVQHIASPIRTHHRCRTTRTLIGLRLNRIERIATLPDTPETWGMIDKVHHLVRVLAPRDADEIDAFAKQVRANIGKSWPALRPASCVATYYGIALKPLLPLTALTPRKMIARSPSA
jgi:large subunit ribosomal protein L30